MKNFGELTGKRTLLLLINVPKPLPDLISINLDRNRF